MNYKRLIVAVLLLPVVALIVLYAALRKPSVNLLTDEGYRIELMHEPTEKGLSVSSLRQEGDKLFFSFTLTPSEQHPYAGFLITKKDEPLFSLNGYSVEFSVTTPVDIPLMVRTNQFIDGFTNQSEWQTFLLSERPVRLSKGQDDVTLKVSDINETPNWWFSINKSWMENKNRVADNSSVSELAFIFENGSPVGVDTVLVFDSLMLKYDASPFSNYIPFALIYYVIAGVVLWFMKHKNVKYVFMPIKEVEINEKVKASVKEADILSYIGQNYQNPDFKITDVANNFNLTESQTSDLLKEYCDKTFRQYLNQIRMEEAKRLLKETNQQISSIAFMVGYNNVQHFNRVFKEYTNSSPSAFRDGTPSQE